MNPKRISAPLCNDALEKLKAGDRVLLTGYLYTARDAAHQRVVQCINEGGTLPFDLQGQVIYYVGPTPAKPGKPIGSAAPTTSGRMDQFTPVLLDRGLKGMIGKGQRNQDVIESIKQNRAVYFAAIGGAAALLAKCVKNSEYVAYSDLGAEEIKKLYVEDLPLIVVVDTKGNNYYELGRQEYLMTVLGGVGDEV